MDAVLGVIPGDVFHSFEGFKYFQKCSPNFLDETVALVLSTNAVEHQRRLFFSAGLKFLSGISYPSATLLFT